MEEQPPIASAAAWSPTDAPTQSLPLLDLTGAEGVVATVEQAPETAPPEPEPEPPEPRPERLSALRDIARKLRSAPDAEDTLQHVIDLACQCTGSDAGMLTITQPEPRQVVSGTALGAGPYISVQLRAGGPSFGEIVLTRMSDAAQFEAEDETFSELVAEYIAKAVSALRRGTVLSDEEQDFIDRITEELRAPVASAVNVLDVVLGGEAGEVPAEQRAYLESTARDQRRMLRLVDDLLTISTLRAPEPRELESIPVGPWLRRSVDAVAGEARERGLELTLADPGEAWIVKAVPAQLDLVMAHLLGNALKFTDSGGRVDVTAMLAEGLLRVTVSDTGIGFDGADASRMVDCFTRGINAEAARIPGAGIGLFLASEILKNHQGRVWLESTRDEGTHAHIAIPLD